MERKGRFNKTITKNILKNTATATTWVLAMVFDLGELTVQAFFSPSLYAELPTAGAVLFEQDVKSKKKPKYKEITIRQSLRRLEKQGFVQRKGTGYKLTKKGKDFANYVLQMKKSKEKKWDKKYRVVIFDIPEKKRDVRDWLRQELDLLDYKKLQNSVFIGKHPLPECVVKKIKGEKISNCVNYLLVDNVYKNIL